MGGGPFAVGGVRASAGDTLARVGPIVAAHCRQSGLEAALSAVAASPADGVMVYHWVDFLEDELGGDGRMVEALRRFKSGAL